jgi:hypothetical protein
MPSAIMAFTELAPKTPGFGYGDVGRIRCQAFIRSVLYNDFMAKKHAFIGNNSAHSWNHQVVRTPRYRRKGLVLGIDVRWKEIAPEVADTLPYEIL